MGFTSSLRAAAALTLAVALTGLFPAAASAEAQVAFTVKSSRVGKPTGLAADSAASAYWTVGKSGKTGTAYAVAASGKVQGSLTFRVSPVDVEGAALVSNRLFIADIGDAKAARRSITVYYFDNPKVGSAPVSYRSWDFEYADGRHDAKTLLVSSAGRIYVVTAGKKSRIYAAPKKLTSAGINQLTKIGNAPGSVTDGVFLPDNRYLALLSNRSSVELLDTKTLTSVGSTPVGNKPDSLALGLDGQSLVLGATGKKNTVYSMPIPAPQSEPSANATPADNSDDEPDDEPAGTTSNNSRRNLALGLAGVAALAAGLVVVLVRRR